MTETPPSATPVSPYNEATNVLATGLSNQTTLLRRNSVASGRVGRDLCTETVTISRK